MARASTRQCSSVVVRSATDLTRASDKSDSTVMADAPPCKRSTSDTHKKNTRTANANGEIKKKEKDLQLHGTPNHDETNGGDASATNSYAIKRGNR